MISLDSQNFPAERGYSSTEKHRLYDKRIVENFICLKGAAVLSAQGVALVVAHLFGDKPRGWHKLRPFTGVSAEGGIRPVL
jgi:hypothetical protein